MTGASEEKSIIIVGASSDRSRFSNKAVRAYRDIGWTVYPVHPTETIVEGLPCVPRIADVQGRAATANFYVRPNVGLSLIEEAPAKGVRRVYLNPGADSPELAERTRALGMEPIEACSIVAIGKSPAQYED
jgi:predicted CoA-binding protein